LTVVLNWIDSNPRGQPPGWEPYPLSLRIVNWLKFLDRHAKRWWEMERASDTARILASLSAQVCALEGGLEKDVLTNHLLKNAKALVFAGGLLQTAGSHRWLREGLEPLKREIQEQILEDGGHFQRSPMYHGQVLEDLLDLEILLTSWPLPAAGAESESGGEVAQLLRERVVKMSGWLQAMLHPDDEIPLMNDSALGMVSPPRELLERVGMMRTARARGHNAPDAASNVPASSGHSDVRILDQSGYATIRHEPVRSFLVFDCGPLGPSYQPGHGHCDLLSFELSLHGMRVVVDTGTSTYEAGPIRSHERSTAAHNTLRIDGEEQAEMWSSFRVGRRPQVGRLTGAAHGNLSFVQGKYSTGARCGVMHARAVIRDGEGGWWFVDLLEGSGEHGVESFIHFHPQVTVELVRQVNAAQAPPCNFREQAILDFGGHRYRLLGPTGTAFKLAESWYSPEFGMRVKNTVASWRWRGRIPAASAFALAPMESRIPEVRLSAERGCCWIGDFKLSLR
ncbi:MAG: heparinase II/III domain-containing protein, partial [Terriglobia bacterium]